MREVLILSAVRTPIGRIRGALAGIRPDDLAAQVIQAALERAACPAEAVDEVILGCANQAGEDNRNIARMAALLAGMPDQVAGLTVNRLCASGLSAVNIAARQIALGEADCIVAGGVESMTRAPYSLPKNPQAHGPSGNQTAWDTTLGWRYPNPRLAERFPLEAMGETAENIHDLARNGGIRGGEITREEADRFALQSQQRAVDAINSGRFDEEIVPVPLPKRRRKGSENVFGDRKSQGVGPQFSRSNGPENDFVVFDEGPFAKVVEGRLVLQTDAAKLAALRPVFREGGSVTAGNSSTLNDGASALLLVARDCVHELNGSAPLARWRGAAAVGCDPRTMGLGPVFAIRRLLERQQLALSDIDLVEVNEAFAVQTLACLRELGLEEGRVNVNGGAIALGHPLGCSGARILTTLLHEMRRRNDAGLAARFGVATLCVGVGQGEATLVEAL